MGSPGVPGFDVAGSGRGPAPVPEGVGSQFTWVAEGTIVVNTYHGAGQIEGGEAHLVPPRLPCSVSQAIGMQLRAAKTFKSWPRSTSTKEVENSSWRKGPIPAKGHLAECHRDCGTCPCNCVWAPAVAEAHTLLLQPLGCPWLPSGVSAS